LNWEEVQIRIFLNTRSNVLNQLLFSTKTLLLSLCQWNWKIKTLKLSVYKS
jgi:hypothetical protein